MAAKSQSVALRCEQRPQNPAIETVLSLEDNDEPLQPGRRESGCRQASSPNYPNLKSSSRIRRPFRWRVAAPNVFAPTSPDSVLRPLRQAPRKLKSHPTSSSPCVTPPHPRTVPH